MAQTMEQIRAEYDARIDKMEVEWAAEGRPFGYDWDANVQMVRRDYPELFGE